MSSYDAWKTTEPQDPFNAPDSDVDYILFACACGSETCVGDGNDPENIRINGAWYASHCEMGKQRQKIAEGKR